MYYSIWQKNPAKKGLFIYFICIGPMSILHQHCYASFFLSLARGGFCIFCRINVLNNDSQTLKHAIVLANMPSEICCVLIAYHFKDTNKLVEAADHVWESWSYNINIIQCLTMSPASPSIVNAEADSDAISASIIHVFGPDACKFLGNHKFSSLISCKAESTFLGKAKPVASHDSDW